MIHNLYKQRGETPLERIQRFIADNPDFKKEKFTYLGRLDPIAEGVLLCASGDDIKRKDEFLNFDKDYDFVALFGFATDSYDVLGRVLRVEKLSPDAAELKDLELFKICKLYEGERLQQYPEFSSKVISKRKMLPSENPNLSGAATENISREDDFISKDDFEPKKITIHKLEFNGRDSLKSKELFGRLLMDISKVKGDFRQHEILTLWKKLLNPAHEYHLGKFNAHVSSGTYIRGIVNDLGNTLGVGATSLSIRRTRVGDYKIGDSIK